MTSCFHDGQLTAKQANLIHKNFPKHPSKMFSLKFICWTQTFRQTFEARPSDLHSVISHQISDFLFSVRRWSLINSRPSPPTSDLPACREASVNTLKCKRVHLSAQTPARRCFPDNNRSLLGSEPSVGRLESLLTFTNKF